MDCFIKIKCIGDNYHGYTFFDYSGRKCSQWFPFSSKIISHRNDNTRVKD